MRTTHQSISLFHVEQMKEEIDRLNDAKKSNYTSSSQMQPSQEATMKSDGSLPVLSFENSGDRSTLHILKPR